MTVPLEAYQGFCQHSFVDKDKTWVALTLNKTGRNEGKYDFVGDNFVLKTEVLSGLISGDDYWLITVLSTGSCNPKEGSFEFKTWKNGADGAKGSFDKVASDALGLQWQKDGCYTAIYCNDIPVLKTLVKVLDDLNIIVRPGAGEITVRLNINDEQCTEIENALSTFWAYVTANDGTMPVINTPAYEAATRVNQAGLMAVPCLLPEHLPNVTLYDLFGKPCGSDIKCFPFLGSLPFYDAIDVTLPKKEDKKRSGNWGNNAVDPKEALDIRKQYVINEFNLAGLTTDAATLADVYKVASLKDGKQYLDFVIAVMGK